MSRLLSSTTPSFAQASYTPLRESRHSTESFPGEEEEDDLDPDSISSPSSQQQRRTRQHSRRSSRSIGNITPATDDTNNHVLASDSDDDSDVNQRELDDRKESIVDGSNSNYPHQQQQRQGSADSSSTIVSIDSNADDTHPPKYARESFEFSEPGHDREYGPGLSVEQGGGGAGGLREAIEGEADKGLWMQVRTTTLPAAVVFCRSVFCFCFQDC
jgi:hypothetical protein